MGIEWHRDDVGGLIELPESRPLQNGSPAQAPERPRSATGQSLLSFEEFLRQEPARWLIQGVLPERSFTVLFAPPHEGKTALALSMAVAVATGEAWLGNHAVRRGPVVYVVGESKDGMRPRVRAAAGRRATDSSDPLLANLAFWGSPVQLIEREALQSLVRAIEGRGPDPALIVVDPLARCFVGGDENSSKDMGKLVDACDALRERFESAILVVHHSTKAESHSERGSSVLRAAADTMLVVKKSGRQLQLLCSKQRDSDSFDPIPMLLEKVVLREPAEELGNTSVRVVPTTRAKSADPRQDGLAPIERTCANYLRQHGGESGLSTQQLAEGVRESRRSLNRVLKGLMANGLVEQIHEGRSVRYRCRPDRTPE